jgi:acetyltransferase-like isoleucine patch superfamily enzyme
LLIKVKNAFGQKTLAVLGKNNVIINRGSFSNVVLDIKGDDNYIEIGEHTVIKNTLIYIRGNHHRLIIKNNCYVGAGELWIEDNNGSLFIDEYSTAEHVHLAVTEPYSVLEIHRDCMLAKYVEIRTGDSHSIIDINTGKRINKAGSVCLQQHVWVGAHAKILKGVTIGNNAIIATASVVTADVPAYSIAAGVPAKVIRSGTDWKRERIF